MSTSWRACSRAPRELDKQALLEALPELIAQTCDPEIEWVEDPLRADRRIYRGHDGVRESWERWLENFEDYRTEIERIVDCGDKALVAAREYGRGAASGAATSQRLYLVCSFRNGKIARYGSSPTRTRPTAPPGSRSRRYQRRTWSMP
jgi:ketosteroid isomerase-like protein